MKMYHGNLFLLSILAHDFNNYLSIITGYIKKLSSSLNDNNFEASQHDLNQIQKIINRAYQ